MEFNAIGSGNWEGINFNRRSFQISVLPPDIRFDIYFEIVGPTAFLSVRTDGPTVFTCKTVETTKKGGCAEDHLGIKNQIKKFPVN